MCRRQAPSQGRQAEALPPLDPGYGLYYHDPQATPNIATRWGYHDGWEDGRHDRNHGDTLPPQNKPHYLTPIDRGMHYGMTRDQYTQRTASRMSADMNTARACSRSCSCLFVEDDGEHCDPRSAQIVDGFRRRPALG